MIYTLNVGKNPLQRSSPALHSIEAREKLLQEVRCIVQTVQQLESVTQSKRTWFSAEVEKQAASQTALGLLQGLSEVIQTDTPIKGQVFPQPLAKP